MLTQIRRPPMFLRVIVGLLILPPAPILFWLTDHYAKMCPLEPDEQVGAVYRLNDHGSIVYLTLAQHRKMVAGQAYLVGAILCFVAVEIWSSRQSRANKVSGPGKCP